MEECPHGARLYSDRSAEQSNSDEIAQVSILIRRPAAIAIGARAIERHKKAARIARKGPVGLPFSAACTAPLPKISTGM